MTLAPFGLVIVLWLLASLNGVIPVKKLITMREARHELKQGSAGQLRGLAGWMFILLWAAATWFCATILGDWHTSGDLDGALERAMLRLRVLLEILAAFGDD